MACISYITPELLNTEASINNFIKVFRDKMIEAGCNLNTTYTGTVSVLSRGTPTNTSIKHYDDTSFSLSELNTISNNISNSTYYICSIVFDLPVGDGSIIYEDIIDAPGFKKVKAASYDTTPCIVMFHLIFGSNKNSSATTDLYGKSLGFVCEYVNYKNKIQSGQFNSSLSFATADTSMALIKDYGITGFSYISLTNNGLFVFVGNSHRTSTTDVRRDLDKFLIKMCLYRNNGKICSIGSIQEQVVQEVYINGDNTVTSMSNHNAYYYFIYKYFDGNFYTTSSAGLTDVFFWPYRNTAKQSDTSLLYAGSSQNILYIPQIKATKNMSPRETIPQYTYYENGNSVVGNFLNIGKSDWQYCIYTQSDMNFSYAVLFEENVKYGTAPAAEI